MSIFTLQSLAMSPHRTEKKKKGAKISNAPKTPKWPTKKSSPKEAYTSIQKTAATAKKKHGKAESTTNGYEGHVRRGMEWLASFAQEEQDHVEECWQAENGEKLCSDDEDDMDDGEMEAEEERNDDEEKKEEEGEDMTMDPAFLTAFTGHPMKCTPVAIAMFMAYKWFTEDLGVSTAHSIHAAFIRYYDTM